MHDITYILNYLSIEYNILSETEDTYASVTLPNSLIYYFVDITDICFGIYPRSLIKRIIDIKNGSYRFWDE
jgi:hypothetical protein